MNLKKLSLAVALAAGVAGVGMSVNTGSASAKMPINPGVRSAKPYAYSHTTPYHMRGTWYEHNSDGESNWMKVTTHSFQYEGTSKMSGKNLIVARYHTKHGRTAYVPHEPYDKGAASYVEGYVTHNGKRYRALYCCSNIGWFSILTHHKFASSFTYPTTYQFLFTDINPNNIVMPSSGERY